jgi:hypothetical protein
MGQMLRHIRQKAADNQAFHRIHNKARHLHKLSKDQPKPAHDPGIAMNMLK